MAVERAAAAEVIVRIGVGRLQVSELADLDARCGRRLLGGRMNEGRDDDE
jgi:hypothetical protein